MALDGPQMTPRFLRYATEWALAYVHYLEAFRAMQAVGGCDYAEEGDSDAPGTPRCYRQWSHISEDWCEPCRQRQPLFEEMRRRKRVTRESFRRLRRASAG